MKKIKVILTIFTLFVFVSAGAAFASNQLTGKVIETMNSGGYSYVLLEKDGIQTWVAAPQTTIKKGETMTFNPGMQMKNFTSKTLGKTFDAIYFSSGIAQ